jgi:hypothetical protein
MIAPRIELDLASVASLVTQLPTPIVSTHDLGALQPTGEAVMAKQDWTERCPASLDTSAANCPRPQARAYDHHDKEVVVSTRIFLVDLDGETINREVNTVNYNVRSTYLFKFDASDDAGNHAEQVVFALILDDKVAPKIETCNGAAETVEAASNWKLCASSTAKDPLGNDGAGNPTYEDVSSTIRYTVEKGSQVLCTNAVYDVAQRYIDTTLVGDFTVTVSAHDHAGAYGVGEADNVSTEEKEVKVQDTRAPWITIVGDQTHEHECATTYSDAGAIANDLLDTEKLHKTITVVPDSDVDSNVVKSDYKVVYAATDFAGNEAAPETRTVVVHDTTKPVLALKGARQMVHHSGSAWVDPGVTVSDTCDTALASTAGAVTAAMKWDKTFDDKKLVDYTATYTVADASGNTATTTRTVTIVDVTAPTISIVAGETLTFEASPDGVYTDAGAECHDYVHGDISNAVIATAGATGDVNFAVPDTYTIHYSCKDASDNVAAQVTRTVVIQDTTCPEVTRTGADTIHVEAGFPYTDEGATAVDTLDGDLTSKITTDGDTVNESVHWVAARSCAEIKVAMQSKQVAAVDGTYHITTTTGREEVWCDMASGNTYKEYTCTESCKNTTPYTGASAPAAGCADYGLDMAYWGTSTSAQAAKAKAQDKYKDAQPSLFPSGAAVVTNRYLCMARALHTHNPYLGATGGTYHQDLVSRAEAGKYVIFYHVQDKALNSECTTPTRTVIVRDTLPPVISLHMGLDDGTHSKAFHVGKGDQVGIGGVINPAGDESVNPNLAPYVDAQGVTHHVVHHASANPENFIIGKMPASIDETDHLMAEQASTSANAWVLAAAASAVAGVALLASSSRKQVATSVPV